METRGEQDFSHGALGPADPLREVRKGHATVTLTMGFLLSPP